MPALVNAQRRINKATYVRIKSDEENEAEVVQKGLTHRPLEKVNYLRSLNLSPAEIDGIRSTLKKYDLGIDRKIGTELLAVTEELSRDRSPVANLSIAPRVVSVSVDDLAALGRAVAAWRRRMRDDARSVLERIRRDYAKHAEDSKRREPTSTATAPAEPESGGGLFGPFRRRGGSRPASEVHPGSGAAGSRRLTSTASDAVSWALAREDPDARRLAQLTASMLAASRRPGDRVIAQDVAVEALPNSLSTMADLAEESANQFVEQFQIEPVGRLHLERLVFMPVGVERSELVYSLPLAPAETVNISHKEWSVRSEEFAQIVQDAFEEYSEEGVTEKKDLSQSTESQQRHTTAFSLSGSYSGYGASVSVGYNSTSDDQQARKDSRQQSITMTRKASTRAKREHKQSFKVEAVVGAEDQSVRVITNPSKTAAMRIDYHQLMRKWQVDLYRYDLRMTYDIVIPSPGVDLLRKLDELRVLDARIGTPFRFELPVDEIDRSNWASYAALFRARVSEPPAESLRLEVHREYPYKTEDEAKKVWFDGLDIDVDPDYEIGEAWFNALFATKEDHRTDANFDVQLDPKGPAQGDGGLYIGYSSRLEHMKGLSGSLAVIYGGNWTSGGHVHARFNLTLRTEAYDRWRFEAWTAMREGAEEMFLASRQTLIERREALTEELKEWDALTLRRMEREEIMKGVLRWLLGPTFELVPLDIRSFFEPLDGPTSEVAALLMGPRSIEGISDVFTDSDAGPVHPAPSPENGADVSPVDELVPTEENWERVMRFGEMIKFLHHAIEWENVLYFTYPYFWDSPRNWDFKRFLQHPDALHREFLRSGSARVVLTVRPGFEVDFTEFVESGALGDNHPYLSIAQEIQNYAQTNYPGIPPANSQDGVDESEVDEREYGVLIGRWYEYTPTSALDISLDTTLADMA